MLSHSELKQRLAVNYVRNNVLMPNEIFEDLVNYESFAAQKNEGRANDISFTFAFYYLHTYLYRECLYGDGTMTTKLIKQILGYNENTKTVDYIVKKGGVLDTMGYTETTTDYPVRWYMDMGNMVEFETISQLKEEYVIPVNMRNFKIKMPLKALYRDQESREERVLNGTYYEPEFTTRIPMDVFMFCMCRKDLGVKGFFLYSFILYKSGYYGGSFNSAFPDLARSVGFSESTLGRVLKTLEAYNMIGNSHEDFYLGRPDGIPTKANAYSARNFEGFNHGDKRKVSVRMVRNFEKDKQLEQDVEESIKTSMEQAVS